MGDKPKYHAIILAAGYGTRLAPVTDEIPKPLIPIGNRTLLDNILHELSLGGVAKFAVNTHHLGEMIACALSKSDWGDKVALYPEKDILGTGGPIVNAREFLSQSDYFILHNGDILTDLKIKDLLDFHEKQQSTVTMVMIDGPENKCAVNEKGIVVDILGKLKREAENPKFTYAGITVFTPDIFDFLPSEPKFCSVVTAILEMMKDNPNAVYAYIPERQKLENDDENSIYWNDLGTVEKFLDAQNDINAGKINLPEMKATIPVPMLPLPHPGGSDRMFFRKKCPFSKDAEGKIIMCATRDSTDFERFLNIGKHLDKLKLGSPRIFNFSSERHVVIMEDLGDDILFNRLQKEISDSEKENLYKKTLDWLIDFQNRTYGSYCIEGENLPGKVAVRLFDFDYLRWETDYFAENFLLNYCSINAEKVDELKNEFSKLAHICLSQPQLMIHRDFQSQNILFKDQKVRIVDFQGARIGHFAYDLMSLLKDPYVELSSELRKYLMDYYFAILVKSGLAEKIDIVQEDFAKFAATAALQRNMQALGAYGFLSLQKGKKEYLNYIPKGLAYLKEGLLDYQKLNPDCPLPKITSMVLGIELVLKT